MAQIQTSSFEFELELYPPHGSNYVQEVVRPVHVLGVKLKLTARTRRTRRRRVTLGTAMDVDVDQSTTKPEPEPTAADEHAISSEDMR